jgi:hypothetical protein
MPLQRAGPQTELTTVLRVGHEAVKGTPAVLVEDVAE